jgi:hypothetical protein
MSLWFQKGNNIDSKIMRQAASNASVAWHYEKIQYKRQAVGYLNADAGDADIIKDELEKLIGYRPVEIDEPTINMQSGQTQ